jgi:hypothetical protein
MKQILHDFCIRSGQTPNWTKSGIIFSKHVPPSVCESIKQIFPVPLIDNNFVHLGHPLILPGKDRATAYNFVFDKFKSKLSTYKADNLSHAARLELIKSVFSSIPVYYMSNILFTKKFIAKLTAIIRNFWWTGIREETNSKGLCLRAWKDICTPKNEGGLGIRNLQAMNQGLILMAAWRIADQPNNFFHAVLKSKYFPNSSIWRPNPNAPKSAFWASIIKTLPILKAHCFYQITRGHISIWSTPWCQNWTHIYDSLIIQQDSFVYPAQVKDLWLPNQKQWDHHLIDTLFQQPMASIIKSTDIIHSQEDDILCWKLTPSGKCNTKSAYRACLQNLQEHGEPKPRQVHPHTVQLLNLIWKNRQITPRVQAFGWRILRRAIPTGARAGKFSKHISKLCSRCGMEEDDTHLFFTCNFAKAAWFISPWFIRSDNLVLNCNSITQIFQNLLNMNHPHASLPNILTFMWCLWKSRNDNLFNRKPGNPHQIHQMAQAIRHNLEMEDIHKPMLLQSNSSQCNATTAIPFVQVQEHMHTIFPEQGETIKTDLQVTGSKIFTDATWKTKKTPGGGAKKASGIGVYCQLQDPDMNSSILIQASIPVTLSVLQAEAAAMILGAKVVSLLKIQHVTFLSDNLTLTRAAMASSPVSQHVPWEIRLQVSEFSRITEAIPHAVYHVKRDINGVAHNCAHQAIRQALSSPIFSCSNSSHRNSLCPVSSIFQSLCSQGYVIHAVHCL